MWCRACQHKLTIQKACKLFFFGLIVSFGLLLLLRNGARNFKVYVGHWILTARWTVCLTIEGFHKWAAKPASFLLETWRGRVDFDGWLEAPLAVNTIQARHTLRTVVAYETRELFVFEYFRIFIAQQLQIRAQFVYEFILFICRWKIFFSNPKNLALSVGQTFRCEFTLSVWNLTVSVDKFCSSVVTILLFNNKAN